MEIAFSAAGGLALFLLAMAMMTDGLKLFGGPGLKSLLEGWTSTPVRGALSGALVTVLVQSSSAVTVATIGFVNAGMLSMRHALGVVFGANVGTTMTGWLVSIVGFGFKIDAFALPVLAVGVALRLLAPEKRYQGLGNAIAGFGLFFLGLAILKDAFSDVAAAFGDNAFDGLVGHAGVVVFFAIGFIATVLTQSSSAAIAIILTAAAGSLVSLEGAAAAIVGASVGTTSTAVLAAIGATANARRVAVGHVIFNIVAGAIALAILPFMLIAIREIMEAMGTESQPMPMLALFHTVFKLLGAAIMLPLAGAMAARLDRLFRTGAEELGRPRYLDRTVLGSPELADAALRKELARLLAATSGMAAAALRATPGSRQSVHATAEGVRSLAGAISEFVTSMRMEHLPRDIAEDLARILRIGRYLVEAARLAPETAALRRDAMNLSHEPTRTAILRALDTAADAVEAVENSTDDHDAEVQPAAAIADFEATYQEAKSALLAAAAARHISIGAVDAPLDSLSQTRRLVEQLGKAARTLALASPAGAGEGMEIDEEAGPGEAEPAASQPAGTDRSDDRPGGYTAS